MNSFRSVNINTHKIWTNICHFYECIAKLLTNATLLYLSLYEI